MIASFRDSVPRVSHVYVAGHFGIQVTISFGAFEVDDATPYLYVSHITPASLTRWTDSLDTAYRSVKRAVEDSGIDFLAEFPAFWGDFDDSFRQAAVNTPLYRNSTVLVHARRSTGLVGVAVF